MCRAGWAREPARDLVVAESGRAARRIFRARYLWDCPSPSRSRILFIVERLRSTSSKNTVLQVHNLSKWEICTYFCTNAASIRIYMEATVTGCGASEDCWIQIKDKVYDVSGWNEHPGANVIFTMAGYFLLLPSILFPALNDNR